MLGLMQMAGYNMFWRAGTVGERRDQNGFMRELGGIAGRLKLVYQEVV
jgi:hypothetical protein